MGRLIDSIGNAGMNAGAAVVARMKRVSEIQTDPRLAGMFTVNAEILASIVASMRKSGYDKSQPLVLWKGNGVVVDGHTRLQAAREAGITEIPVEEKEFAALADAKLYAYRRQAERRNLAPAEILAAAMELQPKNSRDGTGRASEILAKNLGVSPSTVKHAQIVAQEAPPEIIDEVKNNRMTINKAYRLAKNTLDKPAKGKPETDKEKPVLEYAGCSISGERNESTECPPEQGGGRLERLELWVHRENLNIPAGNDARLEAARSLLKHLHGFSVSVEFTQDLHAMLQSLFQVDLDSQSVPEAAINTAGPDGAEDAE
ncbi:MAG: ParB/RepB/Spo0J family partition protein [Treponema sp.]|jgi:ParB family chromosome partitioning protein|nr:ParB/RepB/Spo0J family partition protein [Treponema sp.]